MESPPANNFTPLYVPESPTAAAAHVVRAVSPALTGSSRSSGVSSGRRSSYSTFSSSGACGDGRTPMSCVSRQTKEDCHFNRFFVWAALWRNSNPRVPLAARLQCPLLQCGKSFVDHESMLRHLVECSSLSSGEYFCYDCEKIERFDDLKCKKCLRHHGKRRKIMSMAKSFFSSLSPNNKSKKGSEFHGFDEHLEPGCMELDGNATEIAEADSIPINMPVLEHPQAPQAVYPAELSNTAMLANWGNPTSSSRDVLPEMFPTDDDFSCRPLSHIESQFRGVDQRKPVGSAPYQPFDGTTHTSQLAHSNSVTSTTSSMSPFAATMLSHSNSVNSVSSMSSYVSHAASGGLSYSNSINSVSSNSSWPRSGEGLSHKCSVNSTTSTRTFNSLSPNQEWTPGPDNLTFVPPPSCDVSEQTPTFDSTNQPRNEAFVDQGAGAMPAGLGEYFELDGTDKVLADPLGLGVPDTAFLFQSPAPELTFFPTPAMAEPSARMERVRPSLRLSTVQEVAEQTCSLEPPPSKKIKSAGQPETTVAGLSQRAIGLLDDNVGELDAFINLDALASSLSPAPNLGARQPGGYVPPAPGISLDTHPFLSNSFTDSLDHGSSGSTPTRCPVNTGTPPSAALSTHLPSVGDPHSPYLSDIFDAGFGSGQSTNGSNIPASPLSTVSSPTVPPPLADFATPDKTPSTGGASSAGGSDESTNGGDAYATSGDDAITDDIKALALQHKCPDCEYVPNGNPKWFAGSLSKHRRKQHGETKWYCCPFPGCTSKFKNRPDNLQQHQAQKEHFVDDKRPKRKRKRASVEGEDEFDDEGFGTAVQMLKVERHLDLGRPA